MIQIKNVIISNLNQEHQASLDLEIYEKSKVNKVLVTALVDTGFSGFLALPLFLADHLKLNQEKFKSVELELAIGEASARVSKETIFIQNQPFVVEIIWSEEIQEALIGTAFFAKYSDYLKLDYKQNQIKISLKRIDSTY
jgi:clan AA aspartic protease